jgi:septal ring factor EnvC (AmiA/AmiB activator)
MKHLKTIALVITLIGFVAIGVITLRTNAQELEVKKLEIKSKQSELIKLNSKYDQVIDEKAKTEAEKIEQLKKIEELEAERKRLEAELQAKRDKQEAERQRIAQATKQVTGSTAYASDAKMFIYMKESGNNPNAVNKYSGACGLAQALPCSKMNCALGDYACQDAWATKYMQSRYGTWENAKAFWLANNWW